MNNDLSGGTSSGDIETFHTIQLSEDPSFSIQHIEVTCLNQGKVYVVWRYQFIPPSQEDASLPPTQKIKIFIFLTNILI